MERFKRRLEGVTIALMSCLLVGTLVLAVPVTAYAQTVNPDGTICPDGEYWIPSQSGYWTTPTQLSPTLAAGSIYSTDERFHNLMNQQIWIDEIPSACIPCPNPLVTWGFVTGALALAVLSRGATLRGYTTAGARLQGGSYTSLGGASVWQLKRIMVDC